MIIIAIKPKRIINYKWERYLITLFSQLPLSQSTHPKAIKVVLSLIYYSIFFSDQIYTEII